MTVASALAELQARPVSAGALAASACAITDDASRWGSLAALAACSALAALGYVASSALPCPALRAQVAAALGSLACAAVMAERWAADPERIGRGSSLAALAGALVAAASLA